MSEVRDLFDALGCGYPPGVEFPVPPPPPEVVAPPQATTGPLDVAVTFFPPSRLYTNGSHPTADAGSWVRPCIGAGSRVPWESLVSVLSRSQSSAIADAKVAKATRGGFSLAVFRGHRRRTDDFIVATVIGFDIDGHGELDHALRAFLPYRKLVYATYSSTPEKPRCRVLIPLLHECRSASHYRRAHAVIRKALITTGLYDEADIDPAGQDVARLWYLPVVRSGVKHEVITTEGRPLDLTDFAPVQAPPPPAPKPTPTTPTGEVDPGYQAGALKSAVEKLSATPPNLRHPALFNEAMGLARPSLGLTDAQIADALTYAFLAATPGEGREVECARTIADGVRAGRKRP